MERMHPAVFFAYFIVIAAVGMSFMHPLMLGVFFIFAFALSVFTGKWKAVKFNMLFILPMMAVMVAVNALFNNRGMTVLFHLPSGNAVTVEALLYGLLSALMVGGVICLFSCFNAVMGSDKLVYLFGRLLPSLSLLLTMVLRFVPKYKEQIKQIADAQKYSGYAPADKKLLLRVHYGLSILGAMFSWGLEGAIITADSMRARGYATGKRTSFALYHIGRQDCLLLAFCAVLTASVFTLSSFGFVGVYFFPAIRVMLHGADTAACALCYAALCAIPVVCEITEARKWAKLK